MSVAMIWMDSREARIFHLVGEKIQVERLEYHGHEHHAEGLGRNHPKSQTDEGTFFKQLLGHLQKSSYGKLLLMGPGVSVKHFETYLKDHQKKMSESVVAVEKVDHLPDSEILTMGRQFLHKYFLFQGQIA
jgi:stalled ribosome rescue protein Dom34